MQAYRCRCLRRTGSSHRFCQDRFQIWVGEDRLILTTADGHGGRPYTRSGLGARIACAEAVKLLRGGIDPAYLPPALKTRFDYMTRKHLAQHPLEDWERERLDGRPEEVAYGATFLAAVLTAEDAWLFQLGDGDIHALDTDGNFLPPLAADEDCRGNLTTSLVNERDHLADRFRVMHYDRPVGAVFLYTDGCEGALIPAMDALSCQPELNARLEKLLEQTSRGDDQTFLLALNTGAAETEGFRENLERNLEALRTLETRRRKRRRILREYEELKTYLSLAVRKAKHMAIWQEPGLDRYLASLEPKYLRLEELRQQLAQV